MNDRLKELMLEAGYAAPELAGRAKILSDLILKECIMICKYHKTQSTMDQKYLAQNEVIDRINENIEEYFGVEL
jgi:hypothetical protein